MHVIPSIPATQINCLPSEVAMTFTAKEPAKKGDRLGEAVMILVLIGLADHIRSNSSKRTSGELPHHQDPLHHETQEPARLPAKCTSTRFPNVIKP